MKLIDENKQARVRREIATAVLAGLAVGDPEHLGLEPDESPDAVAAEIAIRWADALIAELEKD